MKLENSTHRRLTFTLACVLLAASPCPGTEALDISGYYKNFSTVYSLPDALDFDVSGDGPPVGDVSNRLRIDSRIRAGSSVTFSVSYDFRPRIQDPGLFTKDPFAIQIDPFSYRAIDFDRLIYPDEREDAGSFAIYHNLDRAQATVRFSSFDVILGRQAIAWGSARVVNPTDIIAPYAYTELDIEDRIGVDAVRIRYPLGFMGELDAGFVAGKDFHIEKSAYYLRGKYYIARTDVSAMVMGFRKNVLVGIDFARSVGGAGTWLEAAEVFIREGDEDGRGSDSDYFRLSAGLDYSLDEKTYGFIEYHYNQAGSNSAEDYAGLFSDTAYRKGSVYLLGRHYLMPGVSRQITGLLTLDFQALVNMGDGSVSLVPTIEYSFAQNVYLGGGAYIGVGQSPEQEDVPLTDLTVPAFRSEFGSYPDLFYLSFRLYY